MFSSILKCKVCGSNYVMADANYYACSGFVNGKVCANDQRFRRDVMEHRLTTAIRTVLLSDASIEQFKAKLIRRLRGPAVDAKRVKKLETEVANMVDTIALGMRSPALLARLQEVEAELERLRAANKVIDLAAILAAVPVAVARYRDLVEGFGTGTPVNIEQAREVIREIAGRIPVRPGKDGVPIAELSLNEEMPLAQVANGQIQIGVVAGACYTQLLRPERSRCAFAERNSCLAANRPPVPGRRARLRQAAAATAMTSHATTLCSLNAAIAGAAANAGPIAPPPGAADGWWWRRKSLSRTV
jgi:hypothetical protein